MDLLNKFEELYLSDENLGSWEELGYKNKKVEKDFEEKVLEELRKTSIRINKRRIENERKREMIILEKKKKKLEEKIQELKVIIKAMERIRED